jgi:hypothetical protein
MKCQQSREQLHLYIDGVLGKQEGQALKRHLAACPECRAELELLRGIVEAIETEPLLEPGADFTSRVMARLPEVAKRKVFSFENIFWISGLSLAYGTHLTTILGEQISIFAKIGHWVLLALQSFVYSKSFAKGLSTVMGLFLSLVIYQLVSLIYDTINRRARYQFFRQPQLPA